MSRTILDFALPIPELMAQLVGISENTRAENTDRFVVFRDGLSEEDRQVFYALLDSQAQIEWAIGARYVLKALRGQEAAAELAKLREQRLAEKLEKQDEIQRQAKDWQEHKLALKTANLRINTLEFDLARAKEVTKPPKPHFDGESVRRLNAQIGEQNQEIRNLKWQLLQALRSEHPQQIAGLTPPPEPAPDWDYKPQRVRPMQRGEVITPDPFGVEVVARQVEAFVTRHGKCMKPDVSAALSPDVRGLLSQAYRHLHASRRIHVDGWLLQPWPHHTKGVQP